MPMHTEQGAYARAAAELARALSVTRTEPEDYSRAYSDLAAQLMRGDSRAIVAAAAGRAQAVASPGEGFVVASGRWASLESDLIEVLNEGVIELRGAPPAVMELEGGQGYAETFKFGPYVAFSRPPEEIEDPDTGAVAWSITVNKDRNWRTVRLAMPKLSAVPGSAGRYTLDGRTPIEAAIIESGTEVRQDAERVDFP